MEINGKLIGRFQPRTGVSKQGKEWMTRDYLIETLDEKYPKKICFEVFGEDKIREIDSKITQRDMLVTVSFDVDAREYNGRWYNTIRAWKIEAGQSEQTIKNAPVIQQLAQKIDADVIMEQIEPNNDIIPF